MLNVTGNIYSSNYNHSSFFDSKLWDRFKGKNDLCISMHHADIILGVNGISWSA